MKILWQAFDTTEYTGGPIVNALRLLPELQKRGHTVLAVIEYLDEHPNADKLRGLGIECYTFPRPRYSGDHVRIFLEQIIRFKPDVFVSNISTHAGLAGHWALRWGIPVIHTHRSDDALNNGMAEFFFAGDQKWRLSVLVAVNRYLLNKVQALTPHPIQFRIIPSGVPLSPYKSKQSDVRRLKVVYSGRLLEKQKRISDVVSAFISLAQQTEEIDFTIIGSGEKSLVQKLEGRVLSEGFEKRIRFIGKLDGENYKEVLANHHIIVLLSDYEGTPGSIMDGMSCGLVPVVYNTNGIEELVNHNVNGIVVNDRQEQFFDAILKLKTDALLRQRLSTAAIETIADRFSLPVVTEAWESLFRDVTEAVCKKFVKMKIPVRLNLMDDCPLLPDYRAKPSFTDKVFGKFKKILCLR